MVQMQLFPLIRKKFTLCAGDYWPEIVGYSVPPQLGNQAGIVACFCLGCDPMMKDESRGSWKSAKTGN
jgi:hypothetical protein